ncbi:CPBP family intramembrane metalloprotease [Phormidesmis priestleyi ULC007]|uniref:CPBP family intramembrane metalloprotease n=1 Tax=Phormidesmis priestleyi ULC007 TaxID=1920490 RepID=A0A2T1DK73_9CYAN|nr:type II CAAX endopeptidase family protein [Phormidesmis priestleyi]PSB20899.1 CPBP family intramembrane metalloprotease [Phormidesmis priestleyi ULC007]PZO51854.1 MAG: CPBP family intramembrane metalloprotease [Phormidesmis priestleyi]
MPTLDRVHPFFAFFAEASVPIRVGVFFAVWVAIWLPIAIPLAIALKWHPFKPLEIRQKLPLVASLYLLAPIVLWAAAWVQNVPFSHYGLSGNLDDLGSVSRGLALGTIGLVVLFGVQTLLGWIEWKSENWKQLGSVLLPTLFLGLWIGVTEELVFRGFVLGQLEQTYGLWSGAIVSSLIFALLHLVWEGSENIPQLPGLWLMGMVLCLARGVDHNHLGLAWGLHAGWVFGMASLDSANLIGYTGRASDWLTGLKEKPLAGAMGLLFLLTTAGALWAMI